MKSYSMLRPAPGQAEVYAASTRFSTMRTRLGDFSQPPPRVFQDEVVGVYPRLEDRTPRMPVGD